MIQSLIKNVKRNRGMALASAGLGCLILVPASPLFVPLSMTLVTVGAIIQPNK